MPCPYSIRNARTGFIPAARSHLVADSKKGDRQKQRRSQNNMARRSWVSTTSIFVFQRPAEILLSQTAGLLTRNWNIAGVRQGRCATLAIDV